MSVRQQIPYKSGTFFITFTCARWLPLFEKTNSYHLVYNWFNFLKSKGHYINAFVIMPNHVHAIISFSSTEKSINKIVGDGKRFMSYEIIKKLNELNEIQILNQLQNLVNETDKARNKKHEVFEPTFDWKLIESDNFMQQKLDYIHENPVRASLPLIQTSTDYVHSSARNYFDKIDFKYEIKPIYEMKDINLTLNNYGLE